MFCKNCGQEIDDKAVVCPHCGVSTQPEAPAAVKTNTLAIVVFVLSFFVAIAGLVCSIIARKQCRERNEGGEGLALAGIIISSVEIAFVVLYVFVIIALAGAAMTYAAAL